MERVVYVLLLVFLITGMVAPFFSGEKINKYVKRQKGTLISTDPNILKSLRFDFKFVVRSINVIYYDKNRNTRKVTLRYFGMFSSFGEDKIIKYNKASEEYIQFEQKEALEKLALDKEALSHQEKQYLTKDGREITVKQEYTYPNAGEFVWVNGEVAPDGKYRLGFMLYIYVRDGRIQKVKMT